MVKWRHGEGSSPGDVSRISRLARIPPSKFELRRVSSVCGIPSVRFPRLLKRGIVRNRVLEVESIARDLRENGDGARRETADWGIPRRHHPPPATTRRADGGDGMGSGRGRGKRQGERGASARGMAIEGVRSALHGGHDRRRARQERHRRVVDCHVEHQSSVAQ